MPKIVFIVAAIAMTALCWGAYGPTLHKGQQFMGGDRLRPFLCVGLAYFVIAVVVPALMLGTNVTRGWTFQGTWWSLLAGGVGALGALGMIMAFNFGGKPSYVPPLVFGLAPVVNSFIAIYLSGQWGEVRPLFLAGLILVVVGAVTVLVTAPKGHAPKSHAKRSAPAAEAPVHEPA